MQTNKIGRKLLEQTYVTKLEALAIAGFVVMLIAWIVLCYVRSQSTALTELESLLGSSFFDAFERLSNLISHSLAATNLFTSLVWALIGFLVYFIIWIVQSLLLGTKQTVQFTVGYIHPPLFDIRKYFFYAALERVVFGLLIGITLLLGTLLTGTLIPTLSRYLLTVLHGERLSQWSLQLAMAVMAIFALVHLLVVCLRLASSRYLRQEH